MKLHISPSLLLSRRAKLSMLLAGACALVFTAGRLYSQQLPSSTTPPATVDPNPETSDALPGPKSRALANPFSGMQITKVYYLAKGQDKQWVELQNTGDKAIDLQGWRLRNGFNMDELLSSKELTVQPKNYVVIVFEGTGTNPVRVREGATLLKITSHKAGDVLGRIGGQLALYEVSNQAGASLRSFVAWGQSPGQVVGDAMAMRLWNNPRDVVEGTEREPVLGMVRRISTGGLIAVENFDTVSVSNRWGVYDAAGVTGGAPTPVRALPSVMFPLSESAGELGLATLSVVAEPEGTKYQFQIAKDKSFKDLVTDVTKDFHSYRMTTPMPPNVIYYWRVRLIHKDGTMGSWIAPRRLVKGYSPK